MGGSLRNPGVDAHPYDDCHRQTDRVTFDYSNLSDRPAGRYVSIARRWLRGVARVEDEIPAYAAAWHAHNVAALGGTAPLWVALGDSLTQGIGASSIEQGWVLQTQRALAAHGAPHRVVNLSISGARVADVLDRELPALTGLAVPPALVTVLIGSNDIVKRDLRHALPQHFEALLAAVPAGTFVGVVPHAHGVQAAVTEQVERAQRAGAVTAVPLHFAPHERASDHFHPNDAGHAAIAAGFTAEILAARRSPGPRP